VPRFDVTCPYGYPGPLLAPAPASAGEDFLRRAIAAFVDGLRQRRIVSAFVRLHPLLPLPPSPLAEAGCVVQHGETVFIDLTRSNEELWQETQRHVRRDIARARRAGYVARIDETWEHFDEFVDVYHENMRRLGAHDFYFFSRDHFRQLRAALGDRLHLCVVEIDGQIACAGIATEVRGIVQTHLSGTRTAFLRHSPTKLRIDFLRRWAKERGNRLLHLGGGLGSRTDGLFAFKAGFSKDRAAFSTWRLITDVPAYRALTAQWEANHGLPADDPTGFFPPYRKP
jgi:lipid II:glycine glycyltransferase (peptidoglycan interpeptide bridge formation enzyme)